MSVLRVFQELVIPSVAFGREESPVLGGRELQIPRYARDDTYRDDNSK